jgi:tRNA pseudouridine38-40 synthase
MKKNYYKAIISYNGSNYYGWQKQQNKKTIQSTIEETIKKIWDIAYSIEGSSRTDAGVHAYGQVAKLFLPVIHNDTYIKKVLNDNLPHDITIRSLELCEDEFSPRKHAIKKNYYYTFSLKKLSPILAPYGHHIIFPINISHIQTILNLFIGTHDFRSFATIEKNNTISTIRTIYKAHINQLENDIYQIHIEGSGFLRYMVRRIVGAAITASIKNYSKEYIKDILEKKNPSHHLITMPAHGLMLIDISFNNNSPVYYTFNDILFA